MQNSAPFIFMFVFLCAGCAMQSVPPPEDSSTRAGCCYAYQDYPWGDYPWESHHYYDPAQVWDDYHHAFGPDMPAPPGG
jgi:hypothetical protein